MAQIDSIKENLEAAYKTIFEFISESKNIDQIKLAGDFMVAALKSGGKIISCGNGGSMCDAMHFAEELTGRFRDDRAPIAALSISDPSHMSCVGNDMGFSQIFSRYVKAIGKPGDVLLAISTSGNSENVIHAVETAKQQKMIVVALTGKDGGKLAEMVDCEIRAPYSNYADRAQEIHIKVIHCLIDYIERNIN